TTENTSQTEDAHVHAETEADTKIEDVVIETVAERAIGCAVEPALQISFEAPVPVVEEIKLDTVVEVVAEVHATSAAVVVEDTIEEVTVTAKVTEESVLEKTEIVIENEQQEKEEVVAAVIVDDETILFSEAAIEAAVVEAIVDTVTDHLMESAVLVQAEEPQLEKQQEQEQEREQKQEQVSEPEAEAEADEEEDLVEEFDHEEELTLVFEREIREPVLPAQSREEEEEVVKEVSQQQEVTEEEQIEMQIETPTTLVDENIEVAKDTVESKPSSRKAADSWASVSQDKVQSLQEVSRVAQHSELNASAPEFKPAWLTNSAPVPVNRATISRDAVVPSTEASTLGTPAKMKSRCRFWPGCTNKSCKFTHPSLPCRDPENCTFGDRCIFIHPSDPLPRPRSDKVSRKPSVAKKRRPQSSDSTATMVAVTPDDVWK
ncbi:hypothetical protein BGZ54_001476, partial [Gamsiella multidivaricata]